MWIPSIIPVDTFPDCIGTSPVCICVEDGLLTGWLTGLLIVIGLSQRILYQVVPGKYLKYSSSNPGENRPLVSIFLIHHELFPLKYKELPGLSSKIDTMSITCPLCPLPSKIWRNQPLFDPSNLWLSRCIIDSISHFLPDEIISLLPCWRW